MKKFLFLSLILLCTAMSAWSYTTGSVTLSAFDADSNTGEVTDLKTGISVKAAPYSSLPCWKVSSDLLELEVPYGYIITGVRFIYFPEDFLKFYDITFIGRIESSDMLVLNGETWEQSDGAFSHNLLITFRGVEAYVAGVDITYHKHEFLLEECYHEGVVATCTTPGMKEYWECSGCGHIYSDPQGFEELSRTSLEIPATNHKNKIYVEAKPATDTEDGYTVGHWHCPDCGKNFVDEECTEQITENMIIRAKNRDWLCFTANTDNSTVELDKVGEPYEAELEFTTTETTWVPYTFGQTITLTDAGDRVFFRNASDEPAKGFSKGFNDYYQFAMTGSIAASGNVMSLLDKTCLATSFPANGTYCFACLFSGCESLTSAPELPAMTLAQGCYMWMFKDCTGLTSAPELPAMTLAYGCYQAMYDNCTGLKQVPALPATTMETFCYAAMFRGCTSLTEAPELSATTLKDYCYSEMFENCTSLETAPALPATALPNRCYDQMFSGCTKLNQVKVAFTEWTSSTTYNWLKGVASKGIIICPDELDKTQTGADCIPTGWSVNGYEISVSAVGWASMYLPIDVTIPEDVEVYYAASASGDVVTLKSIADAIPAHTGVIVKAAAGTVFFPYTATAVTPVEGNLFEGTSVDKACSANENYVLSGKSTATKPIFQPYNGMSLGAFKSYLPKSAVGGAGSIQFRFGDDGDTTVISSVETEVAEDVIYNLAGQRVGSDYRGIVIRNGKKMYNK